MATTDRGDARQLLDHDGNAFGFYAYDAFGSSVASSSVATGGITAFYMNSVSGEVYYGMDYKMKLIGGR